MLGQVSKTPFTYINYFWIGAALMSVILTLLVWNAKQKGKQA